MATIDPNRLSDVDDEPDDSATPTAAATQKDWVLGRRPVVVSTQAMKRMAELIAHPPEPNEALRAAGSDCLNDRARFLAAIRQGMAESEAGLVVSDGDLTAELDRLSGTVEKP